MRRIYKWLSFSNAVILFVIICFLQTSTANLHENSPSSWYISFNANFTELNHNTGKLLGTYNIFFQKTILTQSADAPPLAHFLSPFGTYHDLGLGFTEDESQPGITRYYHVIPTTQDEINLTSSAGWYPWDYYVTGFIVIFNESMNIDESSFFFDVQLSSEIKISWTMSYEFTKIDPNQIQSPFKEFTSEDIISISRDWAYSSIFLLRISFQRSEIINIVSYWVLALVIFFGIVTLWLSYYRHRRSSTALVTVCGFLSAASAALLSLLNAQNPPAMTYLQIIIVSDLILGIVSGTLFGIFIPRHDEEGQSEHMKILREQAIEPFISYLKGQHKTDTTFLGQIEIETSEIVSLTLDHVFKFQLPQDPEIKYFADFLDHLQTGYPQEFSAWQILKREWTTFLNATKDRFEQLQQEFETKITAKTGLFGKIEYQHESPTDTYFDSSRLPYLIYQELYSSVMRKVNASTVKLSIIPTAGRQDMYHISRSPFSFLAQGSRETCDQIVTVVNEFVNDSKLKRWIARHIRKREKLDKELANLVAFLEGLSKVIENGKNIKGRCSLCRRGRF